MDQAAPTWRPSRLANFRLTYPLLVKPLNRSIESRFGMTLTDWLKGMIKQINDQQHINPYTGRKDWVMQEYAEYFVAGTGGRRDVWIETAKDPFDFYTTYIHQDDWQAWMNSLNVLGTEGGAIRSFPKCDEGFLGVIVPILETIGKGDTLIGEIRKGVAPKDREYKPGRGRPAGEKTRDKRFRGILAVQGQTRNKGPMRELSIGLDISKITEAVGKRKGEAGQGAVMGNTSASDLAAYLNWEGGRLPSGNYPAEWLHLSAFSWGGLEDPEEQEEEQGGFSTSQNMENLVFGTSETNSLMTRYEQAWQELYRLEAILHRGLKTDQQMSGGLLVTCNKFDKLILYDNYSNGRYTQEAVMLKEETQEMLKSWRFYATDYLKVTSNVDPATAKFTKGGRPPGITTVPQTPQHTLHNVTNRWEMAALAHDFPFIAYRIDYQLSTEFHSFLLDQQSTEVSFQFFPFRRPLYHTAEAALDAAIIESLWKKANQEMAFFVNNR